MPLYTDLSKPLPQDISKLRLILGDQLNAQHSWFKSVDKNTVYLFAELKQEANYVVHHKQKIAAFFSAMENFALALSNAKHRVIHLTLDETNSFKDLNSLITEICENNDIVDFEYQQPDEYRLAKQLEDLSLSNSKVNKVDTEHFLLPFEDIKNDFKKDKHVKMEFFYRRMRKRFDLLMDGDQPIGGKWNFDSDNRNSLKKDDIKSIPEPLMFANDVSKILERIDKYKIKTLGSCSKKLLWPTTRSQARELLNFFCQNLLANFGRFQDAMTDQSDHSWSLYHSRLSFAINSKMLCPKEVINRVLQHWEKHKDEINLAQVEGFVRQILGWREYVRGIYWANMPDYAQKNFLNAQRKLPDYFWTGKTKMRCMQQAINQSLDYAYAHHIQRLMVTGNFCLLAGIDPDQVDQWYLGIYIDAIEWVEMPNTRGMTQFADHGIVATKPYAASGSYINKMSDHCKSCHYQVKNKTEKDACPFNSLYWHFVNRHNEKFAHNGRMNMVYNSWKKMNSDKQNALLEKAESVLANIEDL